MLKIKEPSVAGMFYPSDKNQLERIIQSYAKYADIPYSSRAVIVPHAGYEYSGALAYKGLSTLCKNTRNIFIFAPAHRVFVQGCALSTYDLWRTPLGDIRVNQQICSELNKEFNLQFFDEAFDNEHAIEVQIPIIQTLLDDFTIVPVLIGNQDCSIIEKIIQKYYKNKDNAFVISSDLSHFLKSKEAKKVDTITAQMIEETDTKNFHCEQACGSAGICALTMFAKSQNMSLIRLGMCNSGDITGDKNRVVGYGSWVLFEGNKNAYIKTFYSNLAKEICKKSIENKGNYEPYSYPAVFDENGACFVTLEINGRLRGCIGSIIAHRTLIEDLIKNAAASAYSDPRFAPLTKEEIEQIDIKISLLSEPKEIIFSDENDLLNKITPYKDGIIIKDGMYQAVYLPSVWEQLSDKILFLNSLKQKAGLSANYFSKNFKAYKFASEYI